MFKKWVLNVLIAIDQLFNALLGGDPDETISSRLGKAVARGCRSRLVRFLVWLLDRIDPGHTRDAVEKDEGKREIWRW